MSIIRLVENTVAEHETRNPFELCEALGVIVQYHPLEELRGYCRISNKYPVITLNEDLDEMPKNFVCAHELGHYYLHRRFNRIFMDSYTRMETGRFENEADKFAAQLLFGVPPMCQEPITRWEMAEILNIPVHQVDTRLIELGIYH